MFSYKNPVDLFFLAGPRFITFFKKILLAAGLLCSLELMCIYVILDLL